MAKICANSRVTWDDGGRTMSGKVKQLLADYAVVKTEKGEYIVSVARLTVSPSVFIKGRPHA